ncbi:MAG: sulfite exporter TauE/SafE family protein [Wenzhouxiangellaceae bacterium]
MEALSIVLLTGLIFAAAMLYAAVGHGGASGYLAAMALFGVAPLVMKPSALVLNILVSAIGCYQYCRAGRFSWSIFWPFAVVSMPLAYLGGLIQLPAVYYKPIVGAVLIYAAWRFFARAELTDYSLRSPALPLVGLVGALLGFLSGLVGVGGGIFLSPLLIALRWESVPKVSGVAAAFILVNSMAGLAGFLTRHPLQLPAGLSWWALAAVSGGLIGARLGSRRLAGPGIKRLLALVLLIAGSKMFLTLSS